MGWRVGLYRDLIFSCMQLHEFSCRLVCNTQCCMLSQDTLMAVHGLSEYIAELKIMIS